MAIIDLITRHNQKKDVAIGDKKASFLTKENDLVGFNEAEYTKDGTVNTNEFQKISAADLDAEIQRVQEQLNALEAFKISEFA
jgi:hypothetical protein